MSVSTSHLFISGVVALTQVHAWGDFIRVRVGTQDCKKGRTYKTQVVKTSEALSQGLGGRRDRLKSDEAMLFVFGQPRPKIFWMKDTWIPLSVLFFDQNLQLLSLQHMEVERDPSRPVHLYSEKQPVSMALEIDQDQAKQLQNTNHNLNLFLCLDLNP